VARIRGLEIATSPRRVCPGETIQASYQAVLDDSSRIPFERRYDRKHPPALHVVFLNRVSREAAAQEDGDWTTYPDPLLSVMEGFRLSVFLKAKPAVNAAAVVAPEYSCLPRVLSFAGPSGGPQQPGADGPDITVRLGLLRSPFYPRLVVASVEVGEAPPFFVMADADQIPPADWLLVESRGGRGGRGSDGAPGQAGADGAPGCPGAAGAPGGPGGSGGPGAAGGRGGRITVIGPAEEPFLVGLVDGRSAGGEGGPGGRGGKGGAGGKGGVARAPEGAPERRCEPGRDGPRGADGAAGPAGPAGSPGPRPQTMTVPGREVFGPVARYRPELAALLQYAEQRRSREP
jgi:hypothetical protein